MKNAIKIFVFLLTAAVISGCVIWDDIDTIRDKAGRNNDIVNEKPNPELPLYGLEFILINNGNAYAVSRGASTARHVTIPAEYNGLPVIEIADYGFQNYFDLESVSIPHSIVNLGFYTFINCENLIDINIPSLVTSINNSMFNNCRSLINITIPDNVISIGNEAFAFCVSLKNVMIPDSVTSIGNRAFAACSGLINITIPDSVTNIDEYAFDDCNNLSSIRIPDGVTVIYNGLFTGCSSLMYVIIPKDITYIGDFAFNACYSLSSVFYGGHNNTAWSNIDIGMENYYLNIASRYYYSESDPGTPNTCWRYVGGAPTVWN